MAFHPEHNEGTKVNSRPFVNSGKEVFHKSFLHQNW